MSSDFQFEKDKRIQTYKQNRVLQTKAQELMDSSFDVKYPYNFEWMGRPIIQYPQDIVAVQEIVWKVKPDLIIETGIAHGGSLILSASLLELNASCGGARNAKVIGIDIDIRPNNKKEIEHHPMFSRIEMIEGSSVDIEIVNQVREISRDYQKIMVFLDSNHTHEHVLDELEHYGKLTSSGSYCVVFDTIVEYLPENQFPDRPWKIGDNPMTAVNTFLKENSDFSVDQNLEDKLLLTVAPGGYLYRT